jgi:AraC-like DNA-binding protein
MQLGFAGLSDLNRQFKPPYAVVPGQYRQASVAV